MISEVKVFRKQPDGTLKFVRTERYEVADPVPTIIGGQTLQLRDQIDLECRERDCAEFEDLVDDANEYGA